MKLLFLPEVSQQFVELAEILYDKGYLSFLVQINIKYNFVFQNGEEYIY